MVDIDIYPERYGGKESQQDLMNYFKQKMFLKRDKIRALDDMAVQLTKVDGEDLTTAMDSNSNIEPGLAGSFRKLEVD